MHLELAVVCDDTVEGVERNIQRENPVQHAHAVDVMVKIASRLGVIDLVEVFFPRVSEGRVPDVMPEGDRLDQIEVQSAMRETSCTCRARLVISSFL